MTRKVILVLVDGLSWRAAHDCLGYMQGMVEAGLAGLHCVESALPSLSRPLYECILTGIRPVDSGVVHNKVVRLSTQTSIFHIARAAGLTTAAAAYHWVSELYNRAPYEPERDRFTDDPALPIQHAVFYHTDSYPDDHLLLDAECLRRRVDPDFLLVHPMNTDDAGHQFGGDSPAYRNCARKLDSLLAAYVPHWLERDYQVIVTSDHGMNDDRSHGGLLEEERQVPLFVAGSAFRLPAQTVVRQTEICGLVADLLGVAHEKPSNSGLLK